MVDNGNFECPPRPYQYGLREEMSRNGLGKLTELGMATRKSNLPGSDEMRPVALRVDRADFCKTVTELREDLKSGELDKETYKTKIAYLQEGLENKDNVYLSFLEGVKPLMVDMGKLGTQRANYIDLSFEGTDLSKPPIVIIPGISNDLNGSGEFPLKLALKGRRIILITYPESWHGKTTKEFAMAVGKSNNFQPHTDFFKLAINQILGDKTSFDICGLSAGAIMASEITKAKNFSDRIGKINLIVPAGITGINLFDVKKRMEMHQKSMKQQEEDGMLPKLVVTNLEFLERTKKEVKTSEWTFRFLTLKLMKEYKWWQGMKEARVIMCKDDGITYGIKNVRNLGSNPQLSIEIISGGHETPATNPDKVIEKMVL